MRITIIYDNTVYPVRNARSNGVYRENLKSDWGFACLVEVENTPKILFDTGGNGAILLSNMEKLCINPMSIEAVFISHSHYDHTGGLSAFLNINNSVDVYVPNSFRGVRGGRNVIYITEPRQIYRNVFSTGELSGIEQAMIVKTEKGLVVIDGCSHPGVDRIFQAAENFGKVFALVGGLHGFNNFKLLEKVEFICPTHCTQHIREIKNLYPDKFIEGGAGRIIEF
ncbi:MAG: MBL fold metallo-hydrolase [Elusimicrobia bacterium]|nr:MBL fold metallo-hydrolase [Elusimicrobiota bacterium]